VTSGLTFDGRVRPFGTLSLSVYWWNQFGRILALS